MPKRSNEFQRLVYFVKSHMTDATVTESKMLTDLVTRKRREVDIVIEMSIAGHPVVVAIECRDRSRPEHVGWVEEMRAKHDRLPTNALVLVSRSGFTPEAQAVAGSYGIELLRFEEADESCVDRLFGEASSLWGKSIILTVSKVVCEVGDTNGLPPESVAALPDNAVFSEDGAVIGTVAQMVEEYVRSKEIGWRFGAEGTAEHKWFEIEIVRSADSPAFLQRLEPLVLRRIERIKVAGPCSFEISEFRLRRGAIGGVQVAWAKGTLNGHEASLIASHQPDGSKILSLEFPKSTKQGKSG